MENEKVENRPATRRSSRSQRPWALFGAIAVATVMVLSAVLVAADLGYAIHGSGTAQTTERAPGVTTAMAPRAFNAILRDNSSNWAGYATVPTAAAGGAGSIQEVTAEWFIPTANCSQPKADGAALDSQWVGLDGFNSPTVEQTGTAAYCPSHGATPTYYLWWEFYPYNSAQYAFTASAGDLVQAYVLYNPGACVGGSCGVYTLNLYDFSSGNSINVVGGGWICNTGGTCEGGTDSSAECISEVSAGGYVLTKVTPVTFYECAANVNGTFKGLGSFKTTTAQTYEITQVGSVTGFDDQTVSSLVSYIYGRSEFTVTWHHYN